MREYLEALITEKGVMLDTGIGLDGHFGLTYEMLVDFIVEKASHNEKKVIRNKLVKIDFHNGDVFHFLKFLAKGMLESIGY